MRASAAAALAAKTDSLTMIGPGFLGFLVVFALALATVLLIRSMTGHLRKVHYDAERTGAGGPGGGEAVGGSETSKAAPDDAPNAGSTGDSGGGGSRGGGGDSGGSGDGGGGD